MSCRRDLLIFLVASAFSPQLALAQSKQPQVRAAKPVRVGILMEWDSSRRDAIEKPLTDTLRELGWIEGRDIVYDRVYAENDPKRLPTLAAELISRAPDLLYVSTPPPAMALAARTRSIPIVFSAVGNPVERGLVKSFARPGANVTGVATIGSELAGKRLQLLREILPKVVRVGVLVSGSNNRELALIKETATPLGIAVSPAVATTAEELDAALRSLAKARVQVIVTSQNPFYLYERKRIVEFASGHKIPVVGHRSELADAGALMTYSSVLTEQIRRAAHLIDKILKGANPADIPVEMPSKYELVVNLQTARTLKIAVPREFLAGVDRVIE